MKLFSLPFLHHSFRMMILIINFAQVPSTSMENLGFGFESELEKALNWLWLYYDYDICHGTATIVCLFLCYFNAHMKHIVDVVYIHAILHHHTLCVPQSTSTTRKIFRETLSFFYLQQQLVRCWASLAPTRILLLKNVKKK